MEVTTKGLIYLYCVTKEDPNIKETENLVDEIRVVYHRGIYAVVNNVSEYEFSEENLKNNLNDLEWVNKNVSIHEGVIEGIMKSSCVIPFKFATLFKTDNGLKAMLEKCAEELRTNLENLEGKEEWGVKIYCDIEKLKETLNKEDEEILKIDKEISSTSAGKTFFLKKKKEELLNIAVNKKINEYGQYSFDTLKKESLQACINKLFPKEVTERKDDMILNTAFLVDKHKVSTFISAVNVLKTQYQNCGFSFDCTGPWPPYNFCYLSKGKS